MKIELKEITVRELTAGYLDDPTTGQVVGYGGKLDIRPPYQREFVYESKDRNAVIDTVSKQYPLNVMYWAVREDGSYEVIDGQQRTISLCQFVNGEFSMVGLFDWKDSRGINNLPKNQQDQILNYRLTVYLCTGTDSERLAWFRTINIAGKALTPQELRNAVYSGPWVTAAKKYFSVTNGPAHSIGGKYTTGTPNRQELLETAIDWISNGDIEGYMGVHQHDPTAAALWSYFQSVINWVKAVFPNYRKEMRSVDWGPLYNKYKDEKLDPNILEQRILELIMDEDVQSHRGIYPYLLTGQEKYLNLRAFDDTMKRKVFERQKGVCPICENTFVIEDMEADHITPWHAGGKTVLANCQMLCKEDNRRKGGR